MYTEYVFENKKYEVASREIKATLFDIVTAEEEKIAQLREKAFIDVADQRKAAELQSLYVQQDSCLREILAVSEKLTKSLQRVDACSRKLKQIEEKNVAQIIENIKEGDTPQQEMSVVPPTQDTAEGYAEPVMVSSQDVEADYSGAADVAMAPEPVDEPVMETTTAVEEAPVEIIHEVMDDIPEGEATSEETKEEIIHEVMDTPEEASAEVQIPSTDAVVDAGTQETTPTVIDTVAQENAPAVVDTVTQETAPAAVEELAIPTTDAVSTDTAIEATSSPLIIPTADTSEQNVLIPEGETPAVEEATSSVIDASSEPTTIPVITVSSDGPLEAVTGSTNLIEPSEPTDGSVIGIPEIVPEQTSTSTQVIPTTTTVTSTDPIVFHKRTADSPKVIMISGKQATKLRQSLPTQEALLSGKGYFKSEPGLEQQLVNNGLLVPDVETKQAQIEQMMNKANELYAAGQIEEAQNMYNQISLLNQELQSESAGIVK